MTFRSASMSMRVHIADISGASLSSFNAAFIAPSPFSAVGDVTRHRPTFIPNNLRENRAFPFRACSAIPKSKFPRLRPRQIHHVARQTAGSRAADHSFRVESAFIEENPPIPIGVMAASVPPQIIISARPSR